MSCPHVKGWNVGSFTVDGIFVNTWLRVAAAILVLAVAGGMPAARAAQGGGPGFVTLCYHDVVPEKTDSVVADAMPVWISNLADQFEWLRDNGYTVIGVDDVLAFRRGEKALPERSVLLTFDDGLASFRRFVYPLLKAHNYKALLALETTWLETPEDDPVVYGESTFLPRSYFMAWSEIKEMADSGLVELASHSHNLHRPHSSMPFAPRQPAAASLEYDPATKTYETPQHLYERVREDVTRSADIIQARTGHRPRVLVWPYGRYNQMGVKAALDAGYVITASLGLWSQGDTIARHLMYMRSVLHDDMLRMNRGWEPGHSAFRTLDNDTLYRDLVLPDYDPQRVMHVDLDAVYDPDPEQLNRNVSALIDRVQAMAINVVYLQAYADPDGNGTANALYFPNRHLPMRADLFNYISWILQSRLGVKVYAWMPVLGFEIPGRPVVQASRPGKEGTTYLRLTPFDAENRRIIKEIYEDLAMHALGISGILFHDDAVLGDYEDASPAAMAWMEASGLGGGLDAIRSRPGALRDFGRRKTDFLTEFTLELADVMEQWLPPLLTSRNVFAQVVLNPESEAWFGQNFANALDSYNFVGLMAMPYMEGVAGNPDKWLKTLAEKVLAYPKGGQKTVFELQAVDWRPGKPRFIPTATLARQMRMLQVNGIGNLGYYPEDPFANHPDVNELYPAFSLNSHKYLRKKYIPASERPPQPAAPAAATVVAPPPAQSSGTPNITPPEQLPGRIETQAPEATRGPRVDADG